MPTTEWVPTVSSVGSILRARTKDTNGNELGTFTEATRPTDAQVVELANTAASDVLSAVDGVLIDSIHYPAARALAVIGTAMLVELSYFPEQVATGRSPYDQLRDLYTQRLASLRKSLGLDATDGVPSGTPRSPTFAFPMDGDPYIIGRRTAW